MIARRRRENFCHLSALKCIFLNKNEGFPNDFESKSQNFRPSAEIMTFYESAPLVARPPSNKGGGHFHKRGGGTFNGIALIIDHHRRVGVYTFPGKSVTRLRTGEIRAFLELLQTPHIFFMELHTCTLPLKKNSSQSDL